MSHCFFVKISFLIFPDLNVSVKIVQTIHILKGVDMKAIFSALILVSSLTAFAATDICSVSYNQKDSTLNWTAFKTPKKVGVKGQFTKFSITTQKATTVDELLTNAKFEVSTDSVSTNDKARDAKIFQFFFKAMKTGKTINGTVVGVKGDKVDTEFTLNGVTKPVVLSKKVDEAKKTITLAGTINVLDFSMKSNLDTLTKACNALHEGVTWPDVEVEIVASFSKSCK